MASVGGNRRPAAIARVTDCNGCGCIGATIRSPRLALAWRATSGRAQPAASPRGTPTPTSCSAAGGRSGGCPCRRCVRPSRVRGCAVWARLGRHIKWLRDQLLLASPLHRAHALLRVGRQLGDAPCCSPLGSRSKPIICPAAIDTHLRHSLRHIRRPRRHVRVSL